MLWLPILCFSLYLRRYTWKMVAGIVLSCAALIPAIIWNLEHEGATFRHVFRSISPASEDVSGNPFEFVIAQIGLFSPLLFLLLFAAIGAVGIQLRKVPHSIAFYWWTTVGFFAMCLVLSCFKKVQGNWAVGAFPTACTLLMSWCAMQKESIFRWLKVALIISILSIVAVFLLPCNGPFKSGMGWQQLSIGMKQAGYNPKEHFLFSDRYQMTSVLSFYTEGQNRAFFLNLHRLRKNQFSYWPGMDKEVVGKDGYFVMEIGGHNALQKAERQYGKMKKILSQYFRGISSHPIVIPLSSMKVALVIRCEGYNGKLPPETDKF